MRHMAVGPLSSGPHKPPLFEPIEDRLLVTGVTIITHGFGANVDSWINGMTTAITTTYPNIDAAIYKITATDNSGVGNAITVSYAGQVGASHPLSGPTSKDPEIIVLVDWSQMAGSVSDPSQHRGTAEIAPALASAITKSGLITPLGSTFSLTSLPLHLIGHSRGGSLMSALGNEFAQQGIAVDQLTLLDPHPVNSDSHGGLWGDASIHLYDNILFADNYYRQDGTGPFASFDFDGEPVTGAFNLQLPEQILDDGAYASEHSDVHLWYHGTIADLSDGEETAPSSWYNIADEFNPIPSRDKIGFAFTRIANHTAMRPVSGINQKFNPQGTSVLLSMPVGLTPQWANLANINVAQTSAFEKGNVTATLKYQDRDSAVTLEWYLDNDKNPFNGNKGLIANDSETKTNYDWGQASISGSIPASVGPGDYYTYIKISSANGNDLVRYEYADNQFEVLETATVSFSASNPPPSDEDTGKQTIVNWATFHITGTKGSTLPSPQYTVVSNSNDKLFSQKPTIDANGTLTYMAAPNAYGTSKFEVYVGAFTDSGLVISTSQFFTITVNNVYERPQVAFISAGVGTGWSPRGTILNLSAWGFIAKESPIASVSFYYDRNLNSKNDPSELLGFGTLQANGKWVLPSISTQNMLLGDIRISVEAVDQRGITTDPGSYGYTNFTLYKVTEPEPKTNYIQYIDANHNISKVTLTGPGTLKAYFTKDGDADIAKLVVDGTSETKSTLTINVTKGKGSTSDQTSISDISISGGLVYFSAPKLNLLGSFNSTQLVRSLTINDVINPFPYSIQGIQPEIKIGGTANDKTILTFGRISNVSISTSSATAFKAFEWLDFDNTPDKLSVYALTSFTISGRAKTPLAPKLDGDFQADVTASIPASAKNIPVIPSLALPGNMQSSWTLGAQKVSSITVGGNVSQSRFANFSSFGSITIKGSVDSLSIAAKELTSFKAGTTLNLSLNVPVIGSVNVIDYISGNFYTSKVGSITTTGAPASKSTPANPGNFSAGIVIFGDPAKPSSLSLTSLSIKGSFTGTPANDWLIGGGIGSINIGGNVTGMKLVTKAPANNKGFLNSFTVAGSLLNSNLEIVGNLGAVSLGSFIGSSLKVAANAATFRSTGTVDNSSINVQGSIGPVTAVGWQASSLVAAKVASLTVTAKAATKTTPAIPGNFTGDLTVTGVGVSSAASAVGPINISGELNTAYLTVNGKLGPITVGSASDSRINASYDLASFTSSGRVVSTHISVGAIGVISALNWLGGSIGATKITSLAIRGSAATPGDFSANINITSNSTKLNALGSATIAGTLLNATWRIAGNAGPVTLGAISNSSIFIALAPSLPSASLPTAKSQFLNPLAVLSAFTITGKAVTNPALTPSFINSRVSAPTLGGISLKIVDPAPTSPSGFVAANKIGPYSRLSGPAPSNLFRLPPKTQVGTYDLLHATDSESFKLQIVD
jgi:pimeloyl-ACP methyl ester carboxylesterase